MYKKKKTYELEVHFGLLVLVVIMLCLNLISNYVIYSARNILNEELSGEMYKTSLSISRYLQNNHLIPIPENEIKQIRKKYKLADLTMVPSTLDDMNQKVNQQKLNKILSETKDDQKKYILKIVLNAEFYTLTRGDGNIYYYAVPVSIGKNQNILILSTNTNKLAYIDDASERLTYISIIALFAITIIYILLYRFILSPFRKLKENAKSAGRTIPKENYEVGSVIDEYQVIIKELKEKELELVELHNKAKQRADSFEQFNEYLLGSMQAGIITIDKSGKILTINNAAEKMCNIQRQSFLGNSYFKLSFLSKRLKSQIEKTLVQNVFHPYEEYELLETFLRVGITISPVCDSETNQVGASILINDISEIKKLQAELEKNRQMSALGEMSAGLAHQLRNSLGAIVGYNQLVKKRLTQNNLETTTVDSMATELNESENLIRRFLKFTKPFDFSPEREDLAGFVEEILETICVRNDFKHIKINFDNKLSHTNSVIIDSLLLKQAILNLIENCKNAYKNENGIIDVRLYESENDRSVILIQDYASGIESEHLNKIFTPFYSTNPSGTGLGLPLAQKIIALHEGQLLVESSVGQGTVFKILIPMTQKANNVSSELVS